MAGTLSREGHLAVAELPYLPQLDEHFYNLFNPVSARTLKPVHEVGDREGAGRRLEHLPDQLRLLGELAGEREGFVLDHRGRGDRQPEPALLHRSRVLIV